MKYDQIAVDNAKKNTSCRQIISKYVKDIHQYPTSYRVNCPFHKGDSYSFDIKDESFFCYRCEIGGDLISMIASFEYQMFIPTPNNEQFERVMEVLGISPITGNAPILTLPKHDVAVSELVALYEQSLSNKEKAIEYLRSRNLDTDTTNIGYLYADRNSDHQILKHYDFIVFPMYKVIDNNVTTELVGLNLRNTKTDDPRLKHRKLGVTGAFMPLKNNQKAFEYDLLNYLICESGTDAIKIKNSVSVFGTGNMSKISNCRALVIDSDKAGFEIAASTDMNIILCDKSDAADSTNIFPLYNFSTNIVNEIIAIALYTPDILILDELLPALEKASSISPMISTIYNIIMSCSERSIQIFGNKLYRRMKMRRLNFLTNTIDTEKLAEDIAELREILINMPYLYNKIRYREAEIAEIADDIVPEMTAALMNDASWKIMETGLYAPNNALLRIRKNITPKTVVIPTLSAEFRHASLWAMVGFPGSGKTTLAGMIAVEYYRHTQPNFQKGKVMLFSFEMSDEEFFEIIRPYLDTDTELENFTVITGIQCLNKMTALLAAAARQGYGFFVIDHAKLLASVDGTSMLENTMIKFNLIAQKLGVIILVLTQPNKDVNKDSFVLGRDNSYGGSALVDKCSVFIAMQSFIAIFNEKAKKKVLKPLDYVSYGKIRYKNNKTILGDVLTYDFESRKLNCKALTLDIVNEIL